MMKIFSSSSWFPIDFGGYVPSYKAGVERKSFTSSEKSCNTTSSENISGCRWDSLRHFNRCSHITWDRRAENTRKLLSWCLAVCLSLTRCCCCCCGCWGRWTHLFCTIIVIGWCICSQCESWEKIRGSLFHSVIFTFFLEILMPN